MTDTGSRSRRSPAKQGNQRSAPQNSINAGLGGVGGGTGIVAIAQAVGSRTVLGEVLLYLAPTISVVASTVLFQLKLQADWYSERWQVKRARKTLERQLSYPHTSDEHKANVRAMLEELDHSVAVAQVARFKL